MANRDSHEAIGGIVGLVIAIADQRSNNSLTYNPSAAVVTGIIFGSLPDVLEPSLNNPHHRQFFHSLAVMGAVGYGVMRAYKSQPDSELGRAGRVLAMIAGGAYLSHLVADSITPSSLPLVGKL